MTLIEKSIGVFILNLQNFYITLDIIKLKDVDVMHIINEIRMISELNASILLNNKRSQHVFEKNGFKSTNNDDNFVYFYKLLK